MLKRHRFVRPLWGGQNVYAGESGAALVTTGNATPRVSGATKTFDKVAIYEMMMNAVCNSIYYLLYLS